MIRPGKKIFVFPPTLPMLIFNTYPKVYQSTFAFIFLPTCTCQKAKFRKKIFIQTISFIIFICPNPVLLVSGRWVSAKTC